MLDLFLWVSCLCSGKFEFILRTTDQDLGLTLGFRARPYPTIPYRSRTYIVPCWTFARASRLLDAVAPPCRVCLDFFRLCIVFMAWTKPPATALPAGGKVGAG